MFYLSFLIDSGLEVEEKRFIFELNGDKWTVQTGFLFQLFNDFLKSAQQLRILSAF